MYTKRERERERERKRKKDITVCVEVIAYLSAERDSGGMCR